MKIVAILSLCVLFLACNKNNQDDGKITYSFYKNAEITLNENSDYDFANIIEGDKLVFEYYNIHPDEEEIADDEYSERIIFKMDTGLKKFSISNSTLAEYNTYFNEYCFCADIGSDSITTGTIKGTKVNDEKWTIEMHLSFEKYGETRIKDITHDFVLKERESN